MGRMTVRLPETLHRQLQQLAKLEDVTLNHYIVYALTRQVTQTMELRHTSSHTIAEQRTAYEALRQRLGSVSDSEVQGMLDEREPVAPEKELTAEQIEKARQRIRSMPPSR